MWVCCPVVSLPREKMSSVPAPVPFLLLLLLVVGGILGRIPLARSLPTVQRGGCRRGVCSEEGGVSENRGVLFNPFSASSSLFNLFTGSRDDDDDDYFRNSAQESEKNSQGFGPHPLSPKFCGKRPKFHDSATERIVGKYFMHYHIFFFMKKQVKFAFR